MTLCKELYGRFKHRYFIPALIQYQPFLMSLSPESRDNRPLKIGLDTKVES